MKTKNKTSQDNKRTTKTAKRIFQQKPMHKIILKNDFYINHLQKKKKPDRELLVCFIYLLVAFSVMFFFCFLLFFNTWPGTKNICVDFLKAR